MNFKKFQRAHSIIGTIQGEFDKYKHYPPYADILVETNSEKASLYSGYVIDYDLDTNNITNLDKIYLLGAHRFREKKETDNESIIHGSMAKIPIKGNVFILSAKNIRNINLTLVPNLTDNNDNTKKSKTKTLYKILLSLKFISILYVYFINFDLFNSLIPSFSSHLKYSGFFQKLIMTLIIIQILSLLSPEVIEEENKEDNSSNNAKVFFKYSLEDFFRKLPFLIGLVIFYWAYF